MGDSLKKLSSVGKALGATLEQDNEAVLLGTVAAAINISIDTTSDAEPSLGRGVGELVERCGDNETILRLAIFAYAWAIPSMKITRAQLASIHKHLGHSPTFDDFDAVLEFAKAQLKEDEEARHQDALDALDITV